MANCPNCGAEVAPTVLSCARCRMPLPSDLGRTSRTWDTRSSEAWDTTTISGSHSGSTSGRPLFRPEDPPPPRSIPLDQTGPAPTYGSSYGVGGEPILDEREQRQRRNTISLVILGATVLAIALVSGIVVLVSLNQPAAEPNVPAAPPSRSVTATAPQPPTTTAVAPESTNPAPTPTTPPAPVKGATTTPTDAMWCSPTVAVPAKGTSCPFANEVAKVVAAADPAAIDFRVTAHSPVTNKDYEMTCVRNSVLTTCTGGSGATVWIRNGG